MVAPEIDRPSQQFQEIADAPRAPDLVVRDSRWGEWVAVVLWPSFSTAGCAVGLFFTLFDPVELSLFGQPLSLSRLGAYSIGFFFFWALGIASSALTLFFLRSTRFVQKDK